MQNWTIVNKDDPTLLVVAHHVTADAETHPKDCGLKWDDSLLAIPIPAVPSLSLQMWDGEKWADNISAVQARTWELVKRRRDEAQSGGCETPLGVVDTDEASRNLISGAVQMAMIAQMSNQPFSIDWTMADNSIETHDAEAMIAMGVPVGEHVAACHDIATSKRSAIMKASGKAGVDAVDIEAGWPS